MGTSSWWWAAGSLWLVALGMGGSIVASPDPAAVALRNYVPDPAPTTTAPTTTRPRAQEVRIRTTTTRPATTTTTLAPIPVPPSAEARCLAAIAASVTPLGSGWREVCSPLAGPERMGGWAQWSEKKIYYDPEMVTAVAQTYRDDKKIVAIWKWQVAHERCHTLEPWPVPEVFADRARLLAYERSIDACAARHGADTRFSVYSLDKGAQGD